MSVSASALAKPVPAPGAAVSAPKCPHRLIPGGIEIGSWRIYHQQCPMSNSAQCDELSDRLKLPSLPEMVFGNNKFVLEDARTGFRLDFTAEDALAQVSHEPPTDVKVAAAMVWSESNKTAVARLKSESEFSSDSSHQDFDWTFTTRFAGKFGRYNDKKEIDAFTPRIVSEGLHETRDCIPMDKLRSTVDPILWFSHLHLFEDELHDNGIADYSTKARVMGTFVFVLVRFWLRVDGVLFRVIDHRYYHEFESSYIIRESCTKEASWDDVQTAVKGDFRKIKDPNEFATHLKTMSTSLEHIFLPDPTEKN